jgi:quercetin dioxygenase-like cupin family protein
MEDTRACATHWNQPEAPTEQEIRSRFDEEGLRPYRWSNMPGDVYSPHQHDYHKVIYVVQGSITFTLGEAQDAVVLRSGDRLDLPPRVRHGAIVGDEGVVCLEGHR